MSLINRYLEEKNVTNATKINIRKYLEYRVYKNLNIIKFLIFDFEIV